MTNNRLLTTDDLSSKQIVATVIGLFVTIGLLVYGYSVLTNEFVDFDDTLLIIDNISVLQAGRFSSVLWAFGHYDPELYIPLTFLSFQFDAVIAGLNPIMFHLDNLVQHIVNALLITWILKMLFKRLDIAVILGLFFLVHPLNTEAVAWASGRKDLFSSLFFFASIAMYVQFRESSNKKFHWASLSLFILGLFAKISIAPLPVVLLLIDWLSERSLNLKSIWQKKAYFIATIPLGLIALLGKDEVLARSSTETVFLLIPETILFYTQKILLPIHLSILYPYVHADVTLANPKLVTSIAVVIIATALLWMKRNKVPAAAVGFAIAITMLVPSFFQYFRGSEIYLATDRYMYGPFLGVVMMLVPVLIWCMKKRQKVTLVVCGIIIIICGALSFQRASVWQNTYTLFMDSTKTADTFGAYEKIGVWLLRNGRNQEAVEALKKSIEISPNSAAYFRLGIAAMEAGNREDAILFTEESLRLSPENSQSLTNMSKFYWDDGDIVKAIEYAEHAVELHPWSEMALGNLASMYTLTGDKEKALIIINQMLDVYPNNKRTGPLLRKLEEE